ncbi:hypothetical protein F444_19839 [Phytophthora nicotianae P1976]|uniref:DDE Tnp4 domain-containing protein n=1 Tax=Phytophthora nicotianae P1976 TaxID=1317066 RepID=A0A080Z6G9_PHYNI|nr:hypothetical protein F444_19839 [Phytophthora nicotianae P1976]
MDPREAPDSSEDAVISDGEAAAYALDSDMKWFVRTAVRGVPRHHRSAYMYQRLLQTRETGNTLEAAVFFSELATMAKPVPTRRVPFNFNSVSEDESLIRFRFSRAELVMLIELMGLTENITRERTKASAIEALYILLYRLAAPVRGTELQDYFGRSESGISNIFLHTLNFLDVKYKKLLAFGGHIAATRLCVYSNAIFEAGSPYTNIWSFIDGTVRGICRPQPRKNGTGKMLTQQSVYNGHKRKHGLKFQTLVAPDGLIIHLFGPFPGRNHDIKMFAKSGLADQVRSDFRFADYRIFGDCAWPRRCDAEPIRRRSWKPYRCAKGYKQQDEQGQSVCRVVLCSSGELLENT